MGAELEEYQRVAPQNSFIHVNQFKGPKELAEYLHVLDQDDKQYNEYFKVCFPLLSIEFLLILSVITYSFEMENKPSSLSSSSISVERDGRIYQYKVLLQGLLSSS